MSINQNCVKHSYMTAWYYMAAAKRNGGKQRQMNGKKRFQEQQLIGESCHSSCSSASVAMRNAAVSFNNGNSSSLWVECSWHNFICQTASIKHLLAVNPQRHKPPEANVETLLLDISQSCCKLCCICEFSNLLFFLLCIKTHAGPEVCMWKSGGKLNDTHTTNYENVNCRWNVQISNNTQTQIHAQSVLVHLQLCNNTTTD